MPLLWFTLFPGASYFHFSVLLSTQNLSQSPAGLVLSHLFPVCFKPLPQHHSVPYRAAIHQMHKALFGWLLSSKLLISMPN